MIIAAQTQFAASIGPVAAVLMMAIALSLGGALALMLSLLWRRLGAGKDPLRSLAPPAGELRLARELKMRFRSD